MTKSTPSNRDKAQLEMAPGRVKDMLRKFTRKRVAEKASVFSTAVLQSVCKEILEKSTGSFKKTQKTVDLNSLFKGIQNDPELEKLFGTRSIAPPVHRKRATGPKK